MICIAGWRYAYPASCHELLISGLIKSTQHVALIGQRFLAVKFQRRIGLEEMVVRADLDRPVAGVDGGERDAARAAVEQAHAQCMLQPGNALAGGRCGDALQAPGLDEAARVGGVHEGLQVGEVVQD